MAQKIQIKRGLQSAVENLVLSPGEMAVALDTGNVYIGITSGVYHVNPPASAAETAQALAIAREFQLTGDVTSNAVSFDGSQNVSFTTSLATQSGLTAGDYAKVTVNSKGVVTGGKSLVESDIPTISNTKVSGLGTAATKTAGTGANNVLQLDANGKIPTTVLPALAISETFIVNSQNAMLALTAQRGDIAIRTDVNKSFILTADAPATLANWKELLTPTAPVQSVCGKTGAVTLAVTDITNAETVLKEAGTKTSLADNDSMGIVDSADSNKTKKVAISILKSTLKTYFDTLYNKYSLPTASSSQLGGVKVGTSMTISNGVIDVNSVDGGSF